MILPTGSNGTIEIVFRKMRTASAAICLIELTFCRGMARLAVRFVDKFWRDSIDRAGAIPSEGISVMAQLFGTPRPAPVAPPVLSVKELASLALAELAISGKAQKLSDPTYTAAEALAEALFNRDDTAYQNLIVELISSGFTSKDLIDQVIPNVARLLGEEWLEDIRSFADVTIGTSRLQQSVRTIGARLEQDGLNVPSGHRALLILPASEQHSLGAFIVANQLRRRGVWVQMLLDCSTSKIGAAIENQQYSMVGLSLNTQHALDDAPAVVKKVRTADPTVPIILGGSVLANSSYDFTEVTGADFVAANAGDALDYCKINHSCEVASSRQLIDA